MKSAAKAICHNAFGHFNKYSIFLMTYSKSHSNVTDLESANVTELRQSGSDRFRISLTICETVFRADLIPDGSCSEEMIDHDTRTAFGLFLHSAH